MDKMLSCKKKMESNKNKTFLLMRITHLIREMCVLKHIVLNGRSLKKKGL